MEPLLKGLLLGFILSISVGPIIFAILKQSITNGHKAGYLFVAGVSLSDITLLTICHVFTSLFELVLNHKALVAMGGAGFLFISGIYVLFFKKITLDNNETGKENLISKGGYLRIFASGFIMNTLNPNVFLFWFAWTAAIGASAADSNHPLTYKIVVFATCLSFVLLTDLLKVALASKLRPRLTEKTMQLINRISGLIILIFSLALLWSAYQYR